jgi:hypothetical protein
MFQRFKVRSIVTGGTILRNARATFKTSLLAFCFLPVLTAFQSPPQDKIGQAVASIKEAYYCMDADYHTDGQRVVWVKSYRHWTPDDWVVMKKEAPHVLKFLGQAIAHQRLDVLEELLPDYYRLHGGVQAFAAAIRRANGNPIP